MMQHHLPVASLPPSPVELPPREMRPLDSAGAASTMSQLTTLTTDRDRSTSTDGQSARRQRAKEREARKDQQAKEQEAANKDQDEAAEADLLAQEVNGPEAPLIERAVGEPAANVPPPPAVDQREAAEDEAAEEPAPAPAEEDEAADDAADAITTG